MKVINRAIEIIAWTDTEGTIHPMKIRIKDKNDRNQVYDITKIDERKTENFAGNKMLIYKCNLKINDKERMCIIRLERDTSKWTLFKI